MIPINAITTINSISVKPVECWLKVFGCPGSELIFDMVGIDVMLEKHFGVSKQRVQFLLDFPIIDIFVFTLAAGYTVCPVGYNVKITFEAG